MGLFTEERDTRGCASSSSNMRIKALVIFFTAMICQSTALREPFTVMDTPEHTGTPGKGDQYFKTFFFYKYYNIDLNMTKMKMHDDKGKAKL